MPIANPSGIAAIPSEGASAQAEPIVIANEASDASTWSSVFRVA